MEVALGIPHGFSLLILSKKEVCYKSACVLVSSSWSWLNCFAVGLRRWPIGLVPVPASNAMRAIMALTTHRVSDVRFDA
eukprot:1119634-Amphidinium_carterae.2